MKYVNEYTNEKFDNAKDCLAAEKAYVTKQEEDRRAKEIAVSERKAAAAKVESARKVMVDAQTNYKKELEAFCKKYGAYHYSSKNVNDIPTLFDDFFNFFN